MKGNISPTLLGMCGTGGGNVPMIQKTYSIGHDERSAQFTPNKTDPLTASDYKQPPIVNAQKTVRRLTPLECERLMGLPDGYTDIEFHGKPAPDSRRYKAIGNGMAVPCSDYVMRRIVEVYKSEQPSETKDESSC